MTAEQIIITPGTRDGIELIFTGADKHLQISRQYHRHH